MPELIRISGNDMIQRLEKLGFLRIRHRGSHVILQKKTANGKIGCVVPLHKELATGTIRDILKQAHISVEEFTKI
ncbi:MAG: type II toxin-antitoxin system HicA family toxin [Candidatus Latescibacteria bacterium]|nr:type II toxin-antitoxin system HicA family toxin [Candidatus Latescibacterota bacterium]